MTTAGSSPPRGHARGTNLGAWLLGIAAAVGPLVAAGPEVWVVNGSSRDIAIIDADLETVVGGVPLTDLPSAPTCVAFSSVEGYAARFAFVGQGAFVRVIDVATRTVVRTVNLAALVGHPVEVRACDAARPREFLAATLPSVESYLHVAAQVQPSMSLPPEPWFVVLDQRALAVDPPGTPPMVAAGMLHPVADGVAREGMDVVVLPTEHGPAFQRAWHTYRESTPASRIVARLVAAGLQIGAPWSVIASHEESFMTGTPIPDTLGLAVPFSREFPVLPAGPGGRVVNLDTGGSCTLGGVPRGVAVTGVGPNGYTVLVVDGSGGGAGSARLVSPQTCAVQSFPVGADPVDVAIHDHVAFRKAFVANRGGNTVTVLRPDGTQANIPVGGGPRALDINHFPHGCTITHVMTEHPDVSVDVEISWHTVGCDPDTTAYQVWCHCAAGCPPECVPDLAKADDPGTLGVGNLEAPAGVFEGGGKWGPLGVTREKQFTHAGGAGVADKGVQTEAALGDITYAVEPCTIGDFGCDPP